MEHLRWILIAVGVLILVGIILFANPNRPSKSTRPRKPGNRGRARRRVEPVLDTGTGGTSVNPDNMEQQPIAGLEASDAEPAPDNTADSDTDNTEVTQADYAAAPSDPPQAADAAPQETVPGADQIVTLYVVAHQRHPISGVELLDAALKAGLHFGEKDIFHRLPQGSDKPMFSMANLTAPGHFDRTAWNLFETQGVTLFMTLPGPTSALVAWDAMLATAERLAELLKAEVQDKQRQSLTRQSIAHQREAMRNYDRQKH